MKSLTTTQINNIKNTIADKENCLVEDITDAAVFEYIDDMVAAEQLKQITTKGSNNVDEWTVRPIRSRTRIIVDAIDYAIEMQLA